MDIDYGCDIDYNDDDAIDQIISTHIQENMEGITDDVDDLTDILNQNDITDTPMLGDQDCYEVEKLTNCRINQQGVKEYLVQWSDDSIPPNWEPEENINPTVIRQFHIQNDINQHNTQIGQTNSGSAHIYLRVSDPSKTSKLFKQSNDTTPTVPQQGNQHFTSYQAYFAAFPAGNFSIESQKDILMKYCVQRKFLISSIEIDDGISARNPKKLPGLQTIITNIKSGETLLILDLSRFSRNTLGGLQILDDLHKRNVHIYSVLDGMNYDTPASRHCVRTTISCAELESDIKSAKLKASIQNIKNMGGYIGSRAPFGFKIIREGTLRKLSENIKEQKIIQMIFAINNSLVQKGSKNRVNMISNHLNQNGFTLRGKKFTKQSVQNLIQTRTEKTTEQTSGKSYLIKSHEKRQQIFESNRRSASNC